MSETTNQGDDVRELALALDEIIEGVPGVVGLTAAEPTLLRAAKESIGVLIGSNTPAARVNVKRSSGKTTVEANIAVSEEQSAPAVAHAVHDAIVDALPALDAAGERAITVRVVDIAPAG
ncbi:hypothetical protein KXS11_08320 [Plantibacter flavus]|uniref:hypothetical protein n=1 Tax=Plantibacter flavus TaxID=150123 RepID=UPI003F162A55